MSKLYQELIERIHGTVSDLEPVIERATESWYLFQTETSRAELFLDSVAFNLHSFYSGLERLFELIARHVDRKLPASETWHRDLLQQVSNDLPDVRPAVISQASAATLDEFRRFRHLVRNTYTTNLMPEKMVGLMSALPELWPQLRAELLAFADFLQALAEAVQSSDEK